MQRNVEELFRRADELDRRLGASGTPQPPGPAPEQPAAEQEQAAVDALKAAAAERAEAEARIFEAVQQARACRYSWAFIGSMLELTAEEAWQRYGEAVGA